MTDQPLALRQGTVDVLLLRTLSWGPMHGYAVSQWVARHSLGTLSVDDAALYQGLHRLEERGWVKAEWGLSENNRKARFYRMTALGRRQLLGKTAAWERYAGAVFRILRTV